MGGDFVMKISSKNFEEYEVVINPVKAASVPCFTSTLWGLLQPGQKPLEVKIENSKAPTHLAIK